MDFIISLPVSVKYTETHDAIHVAVDKLSTMYHYISCSSGMTVGEIAEVITQEVSSFYKVSSAIISGRGSLFIFRL